MLYLYIVLRINFIFAGRLLFVCNCVFVIATETVNKIMACTKMLIYIRGPIHSLKYILCWFSRKEGIRGPSSSKNKSKTGLLLLLKSCPAPSVSRADQSIFTLLIRALFCLSIPAIVLKLYFVLPEQEGFDDSWRVYVRRTICWNRFETWGLRSVFWEIHKELYWGRCILGWFKNDGLRLYEYIVIRVFLRISAYLRYKVEYKVDTFCLV